MFSINLVPEIQKQKQAQAKRNAIATVVGIAIIGVVVLTLLVIGSLKVSANIRLDNTEKNIDEIKAESEQYKELEETVVTLESGLLAIKQTMDGENNWTLLFPHLEAATPQDVTYRSLTIEGDTVEATLVGESVDSIARYLKSYENYQAVTLSGVGKPQEEISFVINNQNIGTSKVKSDGRWVYSLRVPTEEDFVLEIDGTSKEKVTFTQATKTLKSESGNVTTGISNLFTDLVTKQYTKDGSGVNFSATFKITTGVLW
jgi:Tfp pilus assembly protein PilN